MAAWAGRTLCGRRCGRSEREERTRAERNGELLHRVFSFSSLPFHTRPAGIGILLALTREQKRARPPTTAPAG